MKSQLFSIFFHPFYDEVKRRKLQSSKRLVFFRLKLELLRVRVRVKVRVRRLHGMVRDRVRVK